MNADSGRVPRAGSLADRLTGGLWAVAVLASGWLITNATFATWIGRFVYASQPPGLWAREGFSFLFFELFAVATVASGLSSLCTLVLDGRGRSIPTRLTIFLIMSALSCVLGLVASSDYQRVTDSAVEVHFLGGVDRYPLRSLVRAEAACSGTGSRAGFTYWLVFPGARFQLSELYDAVDDLGGDGVVDRITQLDQRLSAMHIPVSRQPSTETEQCITDWAKFARLRSPQALRRLVYGA